MEEHNDQKILARRVRLAVAELTELAVIPSVTASIADDMAHSRFNVEEATFLVEVCPELAAVVLSLANEEGTVPPDSDCRLASLVRQLPIRRLHRAFIGLKPCPSFDANHGGPGALWIKRSDLVLHSVAVAHAARQIARMMEPILPPELAYIGGLLHNVGKMALQQVMPKGYARMVGAARESSSALWIQERKQLGLDHSNIGAYLAQRWHLPMSVQQAIRLHHHEFTAFETLPSGFVLAGVIQLASTLAQSLSLGMSGNFAPPRSHAQIVKGLGLSSEQLESVKSDLPKAVDRASRILRLDMEDPRAHYGDALHQLTISLSDAGESRKIDQQQRELQASFQAFLLNLIRSVDGSLGPLDVAQRSVRLWQGFFQTGKVCLLLYPHPEQPGRQVVLIDELAQSTMMVLDPDLDDLIEIPPTDKSTELRGAEDWEPLFEEIEARFEPDRSRALVLRAGGAAVGALVFELNQPGDVKLYGPCYHQAGQVIGHLLHLAVAHEAAEDLVEGLLTASSRPDPAFAPIERGDLFEALAEMAAGFAHELNNPLSVISGRAQLLAQSETSEEGRQALQQIQYNAREMAQLVEALLGFADPPQPKRIACPVPTIIEEAKALAHRKLAGQLLNIQVDCPPSCPLVLVDSAQMASALANIITNGGQAYDGPEGRVEIVVQLAHEAESISIRVRDHGRGMDAATLRRAIQPFFSSLPAGRKRGMGLAYAQRLVQVNEGHLSLSSEPGQGTTVTLRLPVA